MTVLGGSAFAMRVPGNPPLRHDGTRSVFPIYGDEDIIERIKVFATSQECRVLVTSEGETPEAKAEREAILAAQDPEAVFPSIKCPTCFWFDLTINGYCGLDPDYGWPEETIAAGRESEIGAQCEAECPVERTPF